MNKETGSNSIDNNGMQNQLNNVSEQNGVNNVSENMPNISAEPMVTPLPEISFSNGKKATNKTVLFLIVGIVLVLLLVGGFIFVKNFFVKSKPLYGTWSCSQNTEVVFGKNGQFKMYEVSDKDKLNIVGTYTLDNEDDTDETYYKYEVLVNTKDRTLDGKKYTADYTAKYGIIVNKNDTDAMAMINIVSYNMNNCERKSN